MAAVWHNPDPNSQPFIPSDLTPPYYQKPIQGIYQNCHFIAALMSVAWVNYEFIRDMKNPPSWHIWTDPSNITITFWYSPDPDTPFTSSQQVCINSQLEYEPYPLQCGSRSLTQYEIWPSLYEKAYAKFRQWLICQGYAPPIPSGSYTMSDDDVVNPAVNPSSPKDMPSEHWGGNSLIALAHLTGGVYLNNYRYVTDQTVKKCANVDNTDIYDIIKKCFCSYFAGKYGQKTMVPVTAWTYAEDQYLPVGGSFTGTGIAANHAYAVLGIWASGTKKYIVMRDTYAADPSGSATFASGTWSWTDREYDLTHYNAGVLGLVGVMPTAKTLSFSVTDGVFGLLDTDFKKYIEVVSWVTKL